MILWDDERSRLRVRLFFLFFPALTVFACGSDSGPEQAAVVKDRYERMSPAERQKFAPNPLFRAVLAGNLHEANTLLETHPHFLTEGNEEDKDTPLSLAIQLREHPMAVRLLEKLPVPELKRRNRDGEGYVFLAAQQGYADIIDLIVEAYRRSLRTDLLFDFADLDMPTDVQERALFVAASGAVAETLERHWFFGILNNHHPLHPFFHQRDQQNRTFLHRAAEENRYELISWAKEKYCGRNSWQDRDNWWGQKFVGSVAETFGDVISVGLPGVGLPLRRHLFNRQDLVGDTAMHLAIRSQSVAAVNLLAACEETDFSSRNKKGESYLITTLAAIDRHQRVASQESRQIFETLLHRKTKVWSWHHDIAHYVNLPDENDRTALHWAAQLADPYFYKALLPHADPFARDRSGQTAERKVRE